MEEQTPTGLTNNRRRPPEEPPPREISTRVLRERDFLSLTSSIQCDIIAADITIPYNTNELTTEELLILRSALSPSTMEEEEEMNTLEFDIIFDTGAFVAVTPIRNDFIGELRAPPANLVLKGISRVLPVQGIGNIRWYVIDDCDKVKVIETEGYYVPDIPI
ncbi:MAG: hypothetical protein ACREBR_01660 [bacterium]